MSVAIEDQSFPEVKIFLSGSIYKGVDDTRESGFFWSDAEEQVLRKCVTNANITLLNPNKVTIDKSRYIERFRTDLEMVLESDLVLVDVRTKKGLGVGAELMMAQYEGIPIIGLCPDGSAYRRDGRLHAFVGGLIPHLFDDLYAVATWIHHQVETGRFPRSCKTTIPQAVSLFNLKFRRNN